MTATLSPPPRNTSCATNERCLLSHSCISAWRRVCPSLHSKMVDEWSGSTTLQNWNDSLSLLWSTCKDCVHTKKRQVVLILCNSGNMSKYLNHFALNSQVSRLELSSIASLLHINTRIVKHSIRIVVSRGDSTNYVRIKHFRCSIRKICDEEAPDTYNADTLVNEQCIFRLAYEPLYGGQFTL